MFTTMKRGVRHKLDGVEVVTRVQGGHLRSSALCTAPKSGHPKCWLHREAPERALPQRPAHLNFNARQRARCAKVDDQRRTGPRPASSVHPPQPRPSPGRRAQYEPCGFTSSIAYTNSASQAWFSSVQRSK